MADPWREFERRTRRSREIRRREKALVPMAVVGTVDMLYPVYIVEGEGSCGVDDDSARNPTGPVAKTAGTPDEARAASGAPS